MPTNPVVENSHSHPPFRGSAAHLQAELDLLDLLLWREVRRARMAMGGDRALRGAFITDEDLLELFSRPRGEPLWSRVPIHDDIASLSTTYEIQSTVLAIRLRLTDQRGIPLKLEVARRLANLDTPDGLILLLALCPELDLAYERIFGWLHDDVQRRRPTVGLAVDLFLPGLQGRLSARSRFGPNSPLIRSGLLHVVDPAPGTLRCYDTS